MTLPTALERAQAALQAGRAAEAWHLLVPLRAAIDGHGQALRLYALAAQAAGQPGQAIAALQRIIALERDPPEIVGALADVLGTAGRHDEALAQWTRLTELLPANADAHLNRAISAANAGRHAQAIAAADAGLARFPAHPRLLAVKAMALKNDGQVEESLSVFEQAVAADPDRALTRHNQGVALRVACRFDEACEAFAASEKLGMRGAQFHANWAAAALEAGQVDAAIEHYRKALAEDPSHGESRIGLTRLQVEYRGGADAFAHYEQLAATRGTIEDWIDHAAILVTHRRNAEAAEVAGRAIERFGEDLRLATIHACASGLVGEAAPALERLDRLYRGRDDIPLSSVSMLALRAGDPARAADAAERLTRLNPDDQAAWATLSIAWRLLDDPREQWLCDYQRLVMVTDVPSIDGTLDAEAYAGEVAAMLDPLHQTTAAPGDQSLRGGTQTSGALFSRPDPAIRAFRDAVRRAAERAVATLPDDPTHPFLRRKSTNLDFAGSWSVRLKAGGHHVAHVHHQGWMSSAYYARLPEAGADEGGDGQAGWIQFGVPPAMFDIALEPRRVVEPTPGRLVLFPSYMWHGTIPFTSGDRLTAAFDYQPV